MAFIPSVLGIFSKTETAESGHGAYVQKFQQKTYWFVRMTGENLFEVCAIGADNLPSKVKTTAGGAEFFKLYTPEVGYYETNDSPFLRTIKSKVDAARAGLDEAGLDDKESDFCRTFFLSGKVEARRELATLKAGLAAMLDTGEPAATSVKNREINRLAIDLRKSGSYDEALAYYQNSMKINELDDHLHFNISRVYYDMRDYETCLRHLATALSINPSLRVATLFTRHIRDTVTDLDSRSKEILGMIEPKTIEPKTIEL